MKGSYTLVDNENGEEIELEHENLIDIRAALRYLEPLKEATKHHKGECFDETLALINKIKIPAHDY